MHQRALAVAVAVLVIVPACRTRHEIGIDLSPDGSGTVSLATGLDEAAWQLVADAGDDPLETLRRGATAVHPGSSEEAWEEGGFRGLRAVTPFSSLSELEALFAAGGHENDPVLRVRRRGRELDFRLDAPRFADLALGAALDELRSDPSLAESGSFEVRLRVRLPGRVRTHNAQHVEGDGALVWRLHPRPSAPARATAHVGPPATGRARVAIALLVAVAVVAGALRWSRRRWPPQLDPSTWATGRRPHRMRASPGGREGPGGSRGASGRRGAGGG